jgi:hypothetical protein
VAAAAGWNAASGIELVNIEIEEEEADEQPFKSIAAFQAWLTKQPPKTVVTYPPQSYEATFNVSDITGIGNVLKALPDKYVSLDFTGSTFTSIGGDAFYDCKTLAGIIIQNSVTSIGSYVFYGCGTSLTSVTFNGTIPSSGFEASAFAGGDLRDVFYKTDKTNGTPGTYKGFLISKGGLFSMNWTLQ